MTCHDLWTSVVGSSLSPLIIAISSLDIMPEKIELLNDIILAVPLTHSEGWWKK